jgi:rubrerythrin
MNTEPNSTAELADIEVQGLTRGAFVVRGALAAGAVYGAGTVAPFVSRALAQSGMGDVDIVNFALTLEYLETDFYAKALKLGLSSDVKALAQLIHDDEAQHVDALTATVKKLGGRPAAMPTFKFPMSDERSFLKLAQVLEDTGVGAYNGAAPAIKSKEVLGAAGSIVQVEARHAAAIRTRNGALPAPYAFDRPIQKPAVLSAVKPFIVA